MRRDPSRGSRASPRTAAMGRGGGLQLRCRTTVVEMLLVLAPLLLGCSSAPPGDSAPGLPEDRGDSAGSGACEPGQELCNGEDDDCDGRVDDEDDDVADRGLWYRDADGDGVGAGEPTEACEAPRRFVAETGDCDDGDAGVGPHRNEACDDAGVDEDCDGLVDDEDEKPDGEQAWYPDADGDGYGAPAGEVWRCAPPEGHVADGSDCEDADGTVSPAEIEMCGNGVDDDCDGKPNGCGLGSLPEVGPERSVAWFHQATPSTNFGYALVTGDLDGDGVDDLLCQDYNQPTDGWGRGVAVYFGPFAGEVTSDSATILELSTNGYDVPDTMTIVVGELNGDGLLDVAQANDPGGGLGARVNLWWGGPGVRTGGRSEQGTIDSPDGDSSQWGRSLASGDFDVDGDLDLAIGSEVDAGAYIHAGPFEDGQRDRRETTATLFTTESGSTGTTLAAGDGNGDGLDDLAISDVRHDDDRGGVYVFEGPFAGQLFFDSDSAGSMEGEHEGDEAGTQLAWAADVNGDGADDLAISAPREAAGGAEAGAVYIVYGPFGADRSLSASETKILGSEGDQLGLVAWVGDVGGFGAETLAIGNWQDSEGGYLAGALALFYAPARGELRFDDADVLFRGAEGAYLGADVYGPGDLTGDGVEDLLVTAGSWDGDNGANGATFLLAGGGG